MLNYSHSKGGTKSCPGISFSDYSHLLMKAYTATQKAHCLSAVRLLCCVGDALAESAAGVGLLGWSAAVLRQRLPGRVGAVRRGNLMGKDWVTALRPFFLPFPAAVPAAEKAPGLRRGVRQRVRDLSRLAYGVNGGGKITFWGGRGRSRDSRSSLHRSCSFRPCGGHGYRCPCR